MRVLTSLLLIVAAAAQDHGVFPGRTWLRKTAAEEGFDAAKLKEAIDYAGTDGLETECVSIHRNGHLVADHYWGAGGYNKTNIIWSVSKAFTATLIGTLERDNKLSTSDLMTKWVPEWKTVKDAANITMEEILRHCSGRYYDAITDFVTPQEQADQTAFSIKLAQQFPPGTHDQYNQMAYQTLQRVLTDLGGDIPAYTKNQLWDKLQFESQTFWQPKSFFIGVPLKWPSLYGGVTTSCVDLARFGTLWLHEGNWNGTTIFTKAFYDKAMSQPKYPFGNARRYGNWGSPPSIKSEGLGDQIVVYNPVNNIVLTRIGSSLTAVFKPGTFIDKVMASLKAEDRGNPEDWLMAHV